MCNVSWEMCCHVRWVSAVTTRFNTMNLSETVRHRVWLMIQWQRWPTPMLWRERELCRLQTATSQDRRRKATTDRHASLTARIWSMENGRQHCRSRLPRSVHSSPSVVFRHRLARPPLSGGQVHELFCSTSLMIIGFNVTVQLLAS